MTKEITKAIILQQLQDKLGLREFEAAPFLFDETVVPIYDVGNHLKVCTSVSNTVTVTSTDGVILFTVPPTTKWRLSSYDVIFMTGAFTIAGIYLERRNKESMWALPYLDLEAAQSVSYHVELHKIVLLEPGDKIYANVDGYTSTGNLRVVLDYETEEIR